MLELRGKPEQFAGIFSREALVTPKTIDEKARSIENVVLTENPALVWDWARFEPIREIVLINGIECPEDRQVVLLDAHSRYQTSNIKGSTRDLRAEGNVYVGDTFFSETAEHEWTLAKERHLTATSAGYRTYEKDSVFIRPGGVEKVNGRTFKNDFGDDLTLVIRTRVTIFENSILPIGADEAAKLRALVTDPPAADKKELTKDEINKIKILVNNKPNERNKMESTVITQEQLDKAVGDAQKKSGTAAALRAKNIYSAVNMFRDQVESGFDILAEADKAVGGGESADAFNERVFQSIKNQKALQTEDAKIGLTPEEASRFSISRAVIAQSSGNWDKAGFEKEVSAAARAKFGGRAGGFTIPYDVIANGNFGKRELVVGTDSAGGYLKGTDHLGSSFIDVLRNNSVTAKANATILEGLVGDVAIPKKTTAGSATWISSEGTDATDTSMVFGQLTFSPKTIGARTSMTRQLLLQSNPAIDRLAENDLLASMAVAIDLAAIHGTGSSGQPTGVENQSGIGDVVGSAFSFAKAVSFKTKVKTANAFTGNLFYITNPTIEGSLETTEKASSTAQYLLENGKMCGYPVLVTNQVSSGYMFFADWSQLVIAMWGGLDVIVDAVSQDDGNVKIKVFQSIDIGIRHAGAFVMSNEVAFS